MKRLFSRATSSRARAILWGTAVTLALALVLLLSVVLFGEVEGEEFSPDLVQRRRFSFYELPLLRWQISPIRHFDVTGDLEEQLVTDKLVTKPSGTPRWDLVRIRTGREMLGEAFVLSEYLDADRGTGRHWEQWTKDHLPLARVFWPAVISAARDKLYTIVPDLLSTVRGTSDPEELKRRLSRVFVARYSELAAWHQSHDAHETAVEIYDAALRHDPHDSELQAGRTKSLDQLRRSKAKESTVTKE